jgi:hypothetical protein
LALRQIGALAGQSAFFLHSQIPSARQSLDLPFSSSEATLTVGIPPQAAIQSPIRLKVVSVTALDAARVVINANDGSIMPG